MEPLNTGMVGPACQGPGQPSSGTGSRNRITGVEAGQVAVAHPTRPLLTTRDYNPIIQGLNTWSLLPRGTYGVKKNGSWFRDMCVHPTPSFLLKPSTLPIGCVCAWHAGTSVYGGCNTSQVRTSVSSPGGLGRGGAAYPSWPCSPGSTRFSPGRAPAPHKSAAGR